MSWLRKLAGSLGLAKEEAWEPLPYELRDKTGLVLRSAALVELEERLRQTSKGGWLEHVKMRVFAKHPGMTDAEYDWLWLELRRFFLMTSILRHVPMYSPKVDDIWHEMLLFSREYEAFCKAFAGRVIHHEPHVSGVSKQQAIRDRAWFELMYGTMFTVAAENQRMLGRFRRWAIPKDELDWLERSEAADIRERFVAVGLTDETARQAAADVSEQLAAHGRVLGEYKARRVGNSSNDDLTVAYAAGFLIFSTQEHERIQNSSGDSGVAPNGGSDSKSHDSGSSSDSGSSDSGGGFSCGSSCGGGCGGS